MQTPVRLLLAARPTVGLTFVLAVATSTVVFTATPFLVVPIAEEYGVSVGAAGLMSTAQLAGFVAASWLAGRFLRPSRGVYAAIGVLGLVANLAAALAPTIAVLAAARVTSGLSLGLAAWFGWQAAFGDVRKTGDIAMVGPLIGVIASPAIAALLETVGLRWTFVVLAAAAGSPLLAVGRVATADEHPPKQPRHPATRAARAILAALCVLTLGGSSVFVYAAALGTETAGLSPLVVSLLFSGNALAGIPAARWSGPRGPAGLWVAVTATLAFLMATSDVSVVFAASLVLWGFAFFMAIPTAFTLLASRSRYPQERAGDAQAVMALGRVFGPMLGGAFIANEATTAMGTTACGLMMTAAVVLLYVDRDRFRVTAT